MDILITSKSTRGITVNVDNGMGSSRIFDIVSEIDNPCRVEFCVSTKQAVIDGKTLSEYQTRLLIEFLQQAK